MGITNAHKINKLSQSKVSKQTKVSSGVDKDTKNMVKDAKKEKEKLNEAKREMMKKMGRY